MNRAMESEAQPVPRAKILLGAWVFVVAVSVADAAFFWFCRDTAREGEVKPVVLLVLRCAGLVGVMGWRAAWGGFALFMGHTGTRRSWLIAPVWATGHLYLLAVLMWSCHAVVG